MPTTIERPLIQKILRGLFFGGLTIGIGLYITFQARFMIAGPMVSLTKEPEMVQNGRVVKIEGEARNIARISLNGRPIFTNEHGKFAEDLILENGYTIATIAATDRYGRETTISRPFVYKPASLLIEQ